LPRRSRGSKFSAVIERSATTAQKRRLVLIFSGTLLLGLLIVVVALREVGGASRTVEEVLSEHAESVMEVEHLSTLSERLGRVARSYLLTGEPRFLAELQTTRQAFSGTAALLRSRLDNDEERRILDLVRRLEESHELSVDRAVSRRDLIGPLNGVARLEQEVGRTREQLDLGMAALGHSERRSFELARAEATAQTRGSLRLLLGVAAVAVVLAAALTWLLSRTLAGLERSRRELDASLDKLGRANRDLDAFAGRIAHDLRNILAPLPLSAGRLRRSAGSREAIDSSADKIERIARRAEGLIDALLAFARAGQPPDVAASASVRRAVSEALDDVTDLRSLVGAEVIIEVEDLDVRVADSLLYALVANLLSNALKFVEGQETRRVQVAARRTGTLCELMVSDTGPGIPPEAQSRIFQPFYRAPGAKGAGTGIGLATVQRIVEAYGGRIAVRSQPGEGATFIIRLPLGERHASAEVVPVAGDESALH
jgi:signal transduction histidine kinase